MPPVKMVCFCGEPGVLTFAARRYYVVCTACGYTTEQTWETMTVAIIDWEAAIKKETRARRRPRLET